MTRQSRDGWGRPAYAAACVADATRWLVWWLMKLLVDGGAGMCGLRASADPPADLPRPRALRHAVQLRRDIHRGLAEIDAYLAATCPAADTASPTAEETHRSRSEGGND